jgi:hypothetical protein
MAEPVPFDEQNTVYQADGCADLPACVTLLSSGHPAVITKWKLSDAERKLISSGGCVWLWILGRSVAPVAVGAESPFHPIPPRVVRLRRLPRRHRHAAHE